MRVLSGLLVIDGGGKVDGKKAVMESGGHAGAKRQGTDARIPDPKRKRI